MLPCGAVRGAGKGVAQAEVALSDYTVCGVTNYTPFALNHPRKMNCGRGLLCHPSNYGAGNSTSQAPRLPATAAN